VDASNDLIGCRMCVGEFCSMQERDGRHVLQCAWSRVRLVLGDYDFTSRSPKESVVRVFHNLRLNSSTVLYKHEPLVHLSFMNLLMNSYIDFCIF